MSENITIVDENDNAIGAKPRDTVRGEKLRYRVSALWLKNSNGESLLARRAYTKIHHPGMWGPAVAGTVEEGESYEDNMIKEAEEELGLHGIDMKKSLKMKVNGDYNHFTQWFTCVVDEAVEDFEIQKGEVAEVKWFSNKELLKQLENNPNEFLPKMKEYCEMFD